MALIIEDRVVETTTTTGTGALTLAGAVTSFRAFSSVCATNDTVYYTVEAIDGSGNLTGEWETGLGTYSGANTLTRTTISRSSNANAAVSLAAGTKRVMISTPKAFINLVGPILITETVTASSATNVSFTSIPATYRDLLVKVRGRGTTAATSIDIRMRFNGDTGANYDGETAQINSTTSSFFSHIAIVSAYIGNIAAATSTATVSDTVRVEVMDYRGTTFQKVALKHASLKTGTTAANMYTETGNIWWRNTAAITQIDVFPSAGGFVDGSVVSLYGLA